MTAPRRADSPQLDQLTPLVYDELKRLAHRHLVADGGSITLSTTELVHEMFLKMRNATTVFENRAHFFGAASRAMRQLLVDFARRRNSQKRGGDVEIVALGERDAAIEIEIDQILAVDDALEQLDRIDPRLRTIVELRFFAGVGAQDIAALLGVSARTIERDWLKARLVLLEALGRES